MKDLPTISIIMPVRNEINYIEQSIQTVLRQTYPKDLVEIIIVDGMSDDGTRELLDRLAQNHANLSIFDNPEQIVPYAFNIGLRHATGEIIVRIDGHCRIIADYLHCCIEALRKTGADCVGGNIETRGETYIARVIATAQSHPFGVGGARFRMENARSAFVDTLAFGAYRRQVFERIGYYDEELVRNQDDEFNFRLIQSGGKIWLDSTIRSIYYSRANFGKLWRQYFQYGFYKVRVMQKRGQLASWRQAVPAIFVLGLIGTILSTRFLGKLALVPVVFPYLGANILVMIQFIRTPLLALLLPVAFAILHISYGLGFWWGLWRWRRKKK